MHFKISTSSIFQCTLERAFKAPMLCDVSKVHTGYGLMPKITHSSHDENWGQIGSSKKVYAAKSLTQSGGFVSEDHVLDRCENNYWIIQVDNFQSWMLGFHAFKGTWKVKELEYNKVAIDYSYDLYFKGYWFYPLNWAFAHIFWKKYMEKVLLNVKTLAESNEPFLYA